jgi:hypothetical protein
MAREELRKAVAEATRGGFEVENPVARARGMVKLAQHATPEQKLVAERMEELETRLRRVEQRERGLPFGGQTLGGPSVPSVLAEAHVYAALIETDIPATQAQMDELIRPILEGRVLRYGLKRIGNSKFGLSLYGSADLPRILQEISAIPGVVRVT